MAEDLSALSLPALIEYGGRLAPVRKPLLLLGLMSPGRRDLASQHLCVIRSRLISLYDVVQQAPADLDRTDMKGTEFVESGVRSSTDSPSIRR